MNFLTDYRGETSRRTKTEIGKQELGWGLKFNFVDFEKKNRNSWKIQNFFIKSLDSRKTSIRKKTMLIFMII